MKKDECPCNHCQKKPCTGKPGCTACFGTRNKFEELKKKVDELNIPRHWIAAMLWEEKESSELAALLDEHV